jgi:hypothetical protein
MPNFWQTGALRILKIQWFPLSILIFGQKTCFYDPPSLKFHNRTDINQHYLQKYYSKIEERPGLEVYYVIFNRTAL